MHVPVFLKAIITPKHPGMFSEGAGALDPSTSCYVHGYKGIPTSQPGLDSQRQAIMCFNSTLAEFSNEPKCATAEFRPFKIRLV